jgi:hypothetical protein
MYKNEQLLELIDRAMKGGITEIDDFGYAVLQPEKLARFVRKMQSKTVVLPQARYSPMSSHIKHIDRISFTGRVLKSGKDTSGDNRSLATSDFAKPTTNTNVLTASEFIAIASLRDDALRRNIEKEAFENTMIDLLGEAVGRDLEELALFADTDILYSNDDVLSKTDGWIKLAENKIYGGDSSDFNPAAETYPENMFNAMLEAMPKEYLSNINEWRFWVTWDMANDYRDLLKTRGTALGDSAYTGNSPLAYKGIPIQVVPMLARATSVGEGGTGDVAILGYPNNHVWGVFHRVTIEREREAKERRTDFVLGLEVDAGYEDENAVVVAFKDASTPAS